MCLNRIAAFVLMTVGLVGEFSGQAVDRTAPLLTFEKQNVMPGLKVESLAAGHTRIQFWVNTPTYLAKRIDLEADSFTIRQQAAGGVVIESVTPVRVTGFAMAPNINNVLMLQNAESNVLTWSDGFKLRILTDGTPQWPCCPLKD